MVPTITSIHTTDTEVHSTDTIPTTAAEIHIMAIHPTAVATTITTITAFTDTAMASDQEVLPTAPTILVRAVLKQVPHPPTKQEIPTCAILPDAQYSQKHQEVLM